MANPEHFFTGDSNGALYDTRAENWSHEKPLRENYNWHHTVIETLADLKATLRAGPFAWPGGYPMFFITQDGAALCFATVRKEFRQVVWDIVNDASTGWRVVACDINFEDGELIDGHTGGRIESAYAD